MADGGRGFHREYLLFLLLIWYDSRSSDRHWLQPDLAAIYNPTQGQGTLKRMCSIVCLASFFSVWPRFINYCGTAVGLEPTCRLKSVEQSEPKKPPPSEGGPLEAPPEWLFCVMVYWLYGGLAVLVR